MTPHPDKEIKILARKLTLRDGVSIKTLSLQILTLKTINPDTYEITDITPYTAEQPATTYISAPIEAKTDKSTGKTVIAKAIVQRMK